MTIMIMQNKSYIVTSYLLLKMLKKAHMFYKII